MGRAIPSACMGATNCCPVLQRGLSGIQSFKIKIVFACIRENMWEGGLLQCTIRIRTSDSSAKLKGIVCGSAKSEYSVLFLAKYSTESKRILSKIPNIRTNTIFS